MRGEASFDTSYVLKKRCIKTYNNKKTPASMRGLQLNQLYHKKRA